MLLQKIKRLTGLCLAAALLLPCFAISAQALSAPAESLPPASTAAPETSASAAVVYNPQTQTMLYGKAADEKIPAGFLAKVMTALVAYDTVDMNGSVSVTSEYAAHVAALSAMNFVIGETVPVRDIYYAIFVQGSDEAANILALAASDTLAGFVEKMNSRATELGARNTYFSNPHGINDGLCYTTARDAALILAAFSANSELMDISDKTYYRMAATDKFVERDMYSSNLLLNSESKYYYAAAQGIKNGYDSQTGYSLGAYAEKNGMQLICAVFGSAAEGDGGGSYTAVAALFDWAGTAYEYATVLEAGSVCGKTRVLMCRKTDTLLLVTPQQFACIMPKDYDSALISVLPEVPEEVSAPVNEGEPIGSAVVFYDSVNLGAVTLAAGQSAELDPLYSIGYRLGRFFSSPIVIILCVFVALALIAYIIYAALYNKHHRKRRKISKKSMK